MHNFSVSGNSVFKPSPTYQFVKIGSISVCQLYAQRPERSACAAKMKSRSGPMIPLLEGPSTPIMEPTTYPKGPCRYVVYT